MFQHLMHMYTHRVGGVVVVMLAMNITSLSSPVEAAQQHQVSRARAIGFHLDQQERFRDPKIKVSADFEIAQLPQVHQRRDLVVHAADETPALDNLASARSRFARPEHEAMRARVDELLLDSFEIAQLPQVHQRRDLVVHTADETPALDRLAPPTALTAPSRFARPEHEAMRARVDELLLDSFEIAELPQVNDRREVAALTVDDPLSLEVPTQTALVAQPGLMPGFIELQPETIVPDINVNVVVPPAFGEEVLVEPIAEPIEKQELIDVDLQVESVWQFTDGEASAEYIISSGDGFRVTVWGYPELSEEVTVFPDGMMSYPLVGSIQAAGLNTGELADAITHGLSPYIPSPRVSVVVTTIRSQRFSVLGQVQKAGVYSLWGNDITILEAVAQAGGLTRAAIPEEAKIFRRDDEGTSHIIHVDVKAMFDGGTALPMANVRAGDVMFVPGQGDRKRIAVLGEVNAPGLYTLQNDMTVIDVLSAAGWLRSSGVMESVMVVRRTEDGEHEAIRVDARAAIQDQDWSQHLALQPGDIVYVPKTFISKVGEFLNFFGSRVEPAARSYLTVYDATDPSAIVDTR